MHFTMAKSAQDFFSNIIASEGSHGLKEKNKFIQFDVYYCCALIGMAAVQLDDIQFHEAYPDAFAEDFQYHWFLKNAKLFDEPIRNVKGKLFLWDYEYNEAEM